MEEREIFAGGVFVFGSGVRCGGIFVGGPDQWQPCTGVNRVSWYRRWYRAR